ncbi:hypothetical protein GCM10010353_57280 [Streptomyces chryseus]|nr:hypothetical protein GCM10010353_57280 [Streptomyces chryseus]
MEIGAMGNTLLAAQRVVSPRGRSDVREEWNPALPARGFKQCRVRLISLDEILELRQYGHFGRWIRTSVLGPAHGPYGATRPLALKAA